MPPGRLAFQADLSRPDTSYFYYTASLIIAFRTRHSLKYMIICSPVPAAANDWIFFHTYYTSGSRGHAIIFYSGNASAPICSFPGNLSRLPNGNRLCGAADPTFTQCLNDETRIQKRQPFIRPGASSPAASKLLPYIFPCNLRSSGV